MPEGVDPEKYEAGRRNLAKLMMRISTGMVLGQESSTLKEMAHTQFDRLVSNGVLVKREAPVEALPLIDQALAHLHIAAKASNDQYILDQVKKLREDAN